MYYFIFSPVNQEDSPLKIVGDDMEYVDEKLIKIEKSEDYPDDDLNCNDDLIDGDAEDEAEDDLDDMDVDDDCPADDDYDEDDDDDDFGNDFTDSELSNYFSINNPSINY